MKIIKLDLEDIREALDLVWRVYLEFEAPDYAEDGVNEFKNFIAYDTIVNKTKNGEFVFWGCYDQEKLCGVIATKNSTHISMLFVDREYHRQGIGSNLINTVINECQKNPETERITLNSSPYAIGFYHHLGFVDTEKEKTVNGIRFTPMEYSLKKETEGRTWKQSGK